MLEGLVGKHVNPYRLMAKFFDPGLSDRWVNADNRAHKTFVVLAWLEHTDRSVRLSMGPASISGSLRVA
jgi:hypothetical protein